MNAKQQRKQKQEQIDFESTAIAKLEAQRKPMIEKIEQVARAIADAAGATSQAADVKALHLLGQATQAVVDEAERNRVDKSKIASSFSETDVNALQRAVQMLDTNISNHHSTIRALQSAIPEIECEILREYALEKIHDYDKSVRATRHAFDEMHAAFAAYHPRALPGQHFWPAIRSKQFDLPHIAVDGVKFDGVDFYGVFKHVPDQLDIQRRAAEIEAEELE